MDTNNENKNGTSEQFFREFGKRLDAFAAEVKNAGTKVESEMRDRFEELKKTAEEFRKEERWKDVEASLKKAGTELENAFKAAFRKNQK